MFLITSKRGRHAIVEDVEVDGDGDLRYRYPDGSRGVANRYAWAAFVEVTEEEVNEIAAFSESLSDLSRHKLETSTEVA